MNLSFASRQKCLNQCTLPCCSPFNKMCYQHIVITMISLRVRRTVVLGSWSYFFWMYLSSPPYLRYHTSYARSLYIAGILPMYNILCRHLFYVQLNFWLMLFGGAMSGLHYFWCYSSYQHHISMFAQIVLFWFSFI